MEAHVKEKETSINGIIQTHVLPPSDKVLKKSKEIPLLKPHKKLVVPIYIYDCETWILRAS